LKFNSLKPLDHVLTNNIMAKRFTDTDKWKKPFIRGLEGPYKLLWFYILDDCDHAGIWQVDFEVAEIRIGQPVKEKKALEVFGERVVRIAANKWWIPDFISFQYGELSEKNRLHVSVIQILTKYQIESLAPQKPLTRGQGQGQGNGQGLGQGTIQPPKEILEDQISDDWQRWGKLIVDDKDQYWQQAKGRKVTQEEMDIFLSVATRNEWVMDTQQKFRTSLKGFNPQTNGTFRRNQAVPQSTQSFSGDYSGNGGPVLRSDIDL
jgi:hypothetical protein